MNSNRNADVLKIIKVFTDIPKGNYGRHRYLEK